MTDATTTTDATTATDPERIPRIDRRDVLVLVGLLILAAVLRLPNLATRGTWDGDQGHDMLVLRAFVRDGAIPLLGPPTSIGDVHHGAWYYYLLSPAAFLTGGDSPLAVVSLIAVAGIAAVAVVWWLARSIGGRAAGLAAGFIVAVSAAAIDESTFIWNPNLIALSSGLALAAAWRAWSGGRGSWWVLAAIGVAVTMQCHVLGITLLPIVAIPFVLDARRRPLGREAIASVVVFAVASAPLVANELTTGGSEIRAALDYLGAGRESSAVALPVRFAIVGLRVVSWPSVGLITDGFVVAVVVTCVVVGIVAWAWRPGRHRPSRRSARSAAPDDPGPDAMVTSAMVTSEMVMSATAAESRAARWFGLGLLWSAAFLTLAAPSLAAVTPGLPNDHYHAFADPMVFVLVGLGSGMALRGGIGRPAGVLALLGIGLLAGWNLTHLPPAAHPDGGFPAGQAAADRADAALTGAGVLRDDVVLLRSLPEFKSTEAMAYPFAVLGRTFVAETPKGVAPGSTEVAPEDAFDGLVVLCDDRFAEAIEARCGGPAETAAGAGELLDRFEAAPGRWVFVYGPG